MHGHPRPRRGHQRADPRTRGAARRRLRRPGGARGGGPAAAAAGRPAGPGRGFPGDAAGADRPASRRRDLAGRRGRRLTAEVASISGGARRCPACGCSWR
ncbi:MAG: hypothetical protein GEV09_11875 [Pseudonocardiaceae bacterium]|nr:hypothetical protein [Pseudonocardiaceae bacterium]